MQASDAIVNGLYRVCRDEVRNRSPEFNEIRNHEDFALFAAGGNAREEAFDADYDLIALTTSDDPLRREFYDQVTARLSVALTRLGVMPHNRMADLVGRYVVSVSEMDDVLTDSMRPPFIEMSEVLGARMVIGSEEMNMRFTQQLVMQRVMERSEEFMQQMRAEMADRFMEIRKDPLAPWNLKEDPGGLRDIHMFLQILRARYRLRQPVTRLAVDAICEGEPSIAVNVQRVYRSLLFLMRLRDLYRLTVAASDDLDPTQIELTAGLMGYDGAAALFASLEAHCVRTNREIETVLGTSL
jgi:UTP:GlnB (protein PII) uridylyltransferase